MPIEVEFKYWVDDPQSLDESLALQAEFVRTVEKRDIYFRRPNEAFESHLRLRREGDASIVTTKLKTIDGGTEISDEIEFVVSDAPAFCRFMDRFGFAPFVVKHKKGRAYRAGNVTLELHHVEHLGHFIEVEILVEDASQVEAAREELDRWAERLDLAPESIEAIPYILLIQRRHPARYVFDHTDAENLVRELPLQSAD